MRECTESFCPIDHISIDVADMEKYIRFFETVFGMKVSRVQGSAEAPESVWLDGGIQLLHVEEPSMENGRFQHLAFQVMDVDSVLEKASHYGAVPVPGKAHHWFMLPDGIRFELKVKKG